MTHSSSYPTGRPQGWRAHLERAVQRRDEIGAWTQLDPAAIEREFLASGSEGGKPLAGLSVGVKDIIDVAGFATGCGSSACADHVAFADAAIVAMLRDAGALIFGKTATAEYAYLTPPVTRNPVDRRRSPGGSSSGSAAAVADFQVEAATGTQTAGSIIRPASFCGIVGYKPSHGMFSLAGVKPTSRSLDCIGWMARDVFTTRSIWSALRPLTDRAPSRPPVLGICRTGNWPQASPELRTALLRLASAIGASNEAALPAGLDALHHTIMKFEMRAELTTERLQFADRLSQCLFQFLNDDPVSFDDYRKALESRRSIDIEAIFSNADILVTPAAPGEAVEYGSTGSPIFNRVWTLLGLPCITLPFALGAHGLPLGVQLVARHGDDERLFDAALAIEQFIRDTRPA